MIDETARQDFQETVWQYYRRHGRHDLPWRLPLPSGVFDPYRIMVSELMLQQTQVNRVIPKYQAFLEAFPIVQALASAEQGAVLRAWSGLGYNRRAKFLWQAAQQVVSTKKGQFPETASELIKLSGIGPGTAGAIAVYAHNQPVAFIETNIRTVFIHHFFEERDNIQDKEILELVSETMDYEQPREWYWALMDYGSYLKQTVGNLNHRGRGYAKQSKFEGSLRQVRGQVIRELSRGPRTAAALAHDISDSRLDQVVAALLKEGLVHQRGGRLSL